MQPQLLLDALPMYIQPDLVHSRLESLACPSDIPGQMTEFDMTYMMYNQQQQALYGDNFSLSEAASVCSSNDKPDIPPVPEVMSPSTHILPETIVLQHHVSSEHRFSRILDSDTEEWNSYSLERRFSDNLVAKDVQAATQWHNYGTNAGAIGVTDNRQEDTSINYYDQTKMEEVAADVQYKMLAAREDFDYRLHQNTAPLPSSNNLCDTTEKEMRRGPTTDLQSRKKSFCHLSREELIQRVMQLEKEKKLLKKPTDHSDGSDDEETRPCHWAGCDTLTSSLDQLIVHIRDSHIGSGKTAYYCKWAGCPRESKPFLKRHKMQNHMRTHTGERPFACQVEGCDKRFSRPDSLNTHVKTHLSVRPYSCPIENCSKAYFHSRSLRKHAKSHEMLLINSTNNAKANTDSKSSKMLPSYQSCGSEARQPMNAMSVATKTTTTITNFTPLVHTETAPLIPCRDEQQHYLYYPNIAAGTASTNTNLCTINSFQFSSALLEQQHQLPYHHHVSYFQPSFPQQQAQYQQTQHSQMHRTPYSTCSYIY